MLPSGIELRGGHDEAGEHDDAERAGDGGGGTVLARGRIGYYNGSRPHSALSGQTPNEAYGAGETMRLAA